MNATTNGKPFCNDRQFFPSNISRSSFLVNIPSYLLDRPSFYKSIQAQGSYTTLLIALSSSLHLRSTLDLILTNEISPHCIPLVLSFWVDKIFHRVCFHQYGYSKIWIVKRHICEHLITAHASYATQFDKHSERRWPRR